MQHLETTESCQVTTPDRVFRAVHLATRSKRIFYIYIYIISWFLAQIPKKNRWNQTSCHSCLTEIVKLCKMFIPSVDMNAMHDAGEQRCRLFHRRSPVTKTLPEEWRFSVVEIFRFRHRIAMNWNNWRENSWFYVCPSSKCLGLTLGFCSTPSNFCKSESILTSSSFRL